MTEYSANGWPVLTKEQTKLWIIPGANRELPLRRGDCGFILVYWTDWFDKKIEKIDDGAWDDHGYGLRKIAGTDVWSNHASGTAVDVNALRHWVGIPNTFLKAWKVTKMKFKLATTFEGLITWGGTWRSPDEMHFEINTSDPARVAGLAHKLRKTDRGDRIQLVNANR